MGWTCSPTAGAVSPSPLSLFMFFDENEKVLESPQGSKNDQVAVPKLRLSSVGFPFSAYCTVVTSLASAGASSATSSAAPWILVLPKESKSSSSRHPDLEISWPCFFCHSVFPTASLNLLLQMVLGGNLCRTWSCLWSRHGRNEQWSLLIHATF